MRRCATRSELSKTIPGAWSFPFDQSADTDSSFTAVGCHRLLLIRLAGALRHRAFSVGRVGRKFYEFGHFPLLIQLEGHVIADADPLQQSPVDRHKEARFSAGHLQCHGRGLLIDGNDGAAEKEYFS